MFDYTIGRLRGGQCVSWADADIAGIFLLPNPRRSVY